MNRFKLVNESTPFFRLLAAVALIAVSSCVSVHEGGVGRHTELRPLSAGDDRRAARRCPVRRVYVCERQFRTKPGTCYCALEQKVLQSGAAGG